jgi:hypothetical protein
MLFILTTAYLFSVLVLTPLAIVAILYIQIKRLPSRDIQGQRIVTFIPVPASKKSRDPQLAYLAYHRTTTYKY